MRAEEALRDSVKQKEILMKELQHRVKNSLAVVSGLLGLGMEAMDDEAARMIFTETRARIRRRSADLYERICKENRISYDLVSEFTPELLPVIYPG